MTAFSAKRLISKLAFSAALCTAVYSAAPNMAAAEVSNNEDTYRFLNLFGDVFERVKAEYVEEVDDQALIESAINGMLTNLDPHSSYLNEDSFRDMQVQTRGEFGGLGIEVTMESGLVKVVSPIDDTPAFRAGLKAGDYITHLDGEPVMGMTLSDAVDRMRGKVGTDIRLTIRRKGMADALEVTITRDVIQIQSVRFRQEGEVGYLRITAFNQQTQPGLEKAIKTLKKDIGDGLIGYVIDLRNNPGGLLQQAISVSDTFLDKGEIVSTRGRNPQDTKRDNATPGDMTDGKPLVVLVNDGSASASEIVAGALQDHSRAIIMGTQSFGKGSVQTIITLPGHGAMRLTTARYYTPSGRSIQAKGIEPDIIVEQARVEKVDNGYDSIHESDLRGALENTGEGYDPKADKAGGDDDAKKEEKDPKADDYQLVRAIDLLKGISLYKTASE